LQLYGRTIPTIFLILVPSFIGICYYFYGYYYFVAFSTGNSVNLHSNYLAFLVLRSGQACYSIVIAYGLFPIISTEKHTKKRPYENIVVEFEFIKKIVFTVMPILILILIVDGIFTNLQLYRSDLISQYLPLYDLFFAIFASSVAVAIGAVLRIATQVARGAFRLYLAKGYCMIASRKEGDLDKMKYLFLSLDSYNKYLLRKIKFGVKNINKIYSLIICIDSKKKDEMINSICKCLAGDRLELATYLAAHYEVPQTEEFFSKGSFIQILKAAGAFLVAGIPIVISIIQLVKQ
jgi:hypothetical protein